MDVLCEKRFTPEPPRQSRPGAKSHLAFSFATAAGTKPLQQASCVSLCAVSRPYFPFSPLTSPGQHFLRCTRGPSRLLRFYRNRLRPARPFDRAPAPGSRGRGLCASPWSFAKREHASASRFSATSAEPTRHSGSGGSWPPALPELNFGSPDQAAVCFLLPIAQHSGAGRLHSVIGNSSS